MRLPRFLLIAASLLTLACTSDTEERPLVVVSIAPQGWLVERLAGDAVRLEVALAPGESPASFDPTPRRLTAFTGADLYLSIGVPMESVLLPRMGGLSDDLTIVDLTQGQTLLAGHDHDHGHGHAHDHGADESFDPHVWVSPRRMIDMADTAALALSSLVPERADAIDAALAALQADLATLDADVAALLAPAAGRTMVVFHPSFGYLANDYGFVQIAIEKDGLPPSPRHFTGVLDRIREQGVRAIFVQPQSSSSQLKALADAEGLIIEVLDPLAADYPANMRAMAARIGASLAPSAPGSTP